MPAPALSLSPASPLDESVDAVILFACTGDDGGELLLPPGIPYDAAPFTDLKKNAVQLGASGRAEEVTCLPGGDTGPRIFAIVGVGKIGRTAKTGPVKTPDAATLRRAAGAATRHLTDVESVALIVEGGPELAAAALEGAALGAYAYTEYRSTPKPAITSISLHTSHEATAIGLDRVRVIVAAVTSTRDLVNASPADLFPQRFAEIAVETASAVGVEVRVWDEKELGADGFGGIAGVGQGSSHPPRLVKLSYRPEGASQHLALVGKGITFDSGGLSLKPAASMAGMKTDMAGAAAVLAVIVALAELKVPVRVTGWLCLAETLPSATAIRPNDVLRIRGGTTVEVTNTDAEGRLVLADGIVAASEEHPDAIIDIATLTGAQIVSLGHRISGLMGNDALVAQVRSAADEIDEAVWPMPLPSDLLTSLTSDVADLANAKMGAALPGMLVAGVFLREFVGTQAESEHRIPWAHLDIAGPSHNSAAGWGFTGAGATGVGVRTLVRLGEVLAHQVVGS